MKIAELPENIQTLIKADPNSDFVRRFLAGKYSIRLPEETLTIELVEKAILDKTPPIILSNRTISPRNTNLGMPVRVSYSETEFGRCRYSVTQHYTNTMFVPDGIVQQGYDAVKEWLESCDYWEDADNVDTGTYRHDDHESEDCEGNGDFDIDSDLSEALASYLRLHPELETDENEEDVE